MARGGVKAMTHTYRFVVMEGEHADYPAIVRRALASIDLAAEVDSVPHMYTRDFTRAKLKHFRHVLLRRHPDERVLFWPGPIELYLDEPDLSFACSAYRSWFDEQRMMVLPHPWTPASPLADRVTLRWHSKPPCAIGFMGSSYRNSRGASVVARLPESVRRWILEGRLRTDADRLAWLYEHKIPVYFLPVFARFELLLSVAAKGRRDGAEIEIIDTSGFDGSAEKKRDFADHMARTTYVLCPRGIENYSFRAYEALRFGRVPVIIDFDMVLPSMVDWDRVALVVPGDHMHETYDRIVEDYRRRDAASFLKRQEAAFAGSDMLDEDAWLAQAIREAVRRVESREVSTQRTGARVGLLERAIGG